MFKDIRNAIVEEYSGVRAKGYVSEISQYHRIQASPGFRAAAHHVREVLAAMGLSAQVLTFPANDQTVYWGSPMFQEWEATEATLHLIEPAEKARKLADFSEQKTSLIQRSMPADHVEAEVVLLEDGEEEQEYESRTERGMEYRGLDLRGKVVMTKGDLDRVHYLAVGKYGAVGILFDGMHESPPVYQRIDHPDLLRYTSFWWRPGDKHCFGFVVSPRVGEELRKLIRLQHSEGKPPLRVRAHVVSRMYDGQMEVVSALISGETNEEVVVVAHLCHPQPSANDNASGSAAVIELARTLQDLIHSGKLARPKRGVRLLWVPEMTGTFAYLASNPQHIRRMVAGVNLDMVGENQDVCGSVFIVEATPAAMPSFATDLLDRMREEWLEGAQSLGGSASYPLFRHTVNPFSGGSDHYVFSDPTVGVPMPMLIQWPDKFWHTSGDTLEKVDPRMLGVLGGLATTYAYFLANAGRREANWLGNEMLARFRARLARTVQGALTDAVAAKDGEELSQAATRLIRRAEFARDRQREAFRSLLRLATQENGLVTDLQAEVDRAVDHELERARAVLQRQAQELGLPEVPSPLQKQPESSDKEAATLVPGRLFPGPVSPGAYLHRLSSVEREEVRAWQKEHRTLYHGMATVANYWVDGKRTVAEIADLVELETGKRDVPLLVRHCKLLARLELMSLRTVAA
jgi:aminopeptidase-like protein